MARPKIKGLLYFPYQKDLQVYRTYSALCLEYAETDTKNYAG